MPSLPNPAEAFEHRSTSVAGIWLAMAVWAIAVVAAVQTDALGTLGREFMIGFAQLVALGISLPTAACLIVPHVCAAVDRIGLHRLTAMHVWCIPAALLFLYCGLKGQGPFGADLDCGISAA